MTDKELIKQEIEKQIDYAEDDTRYTEPYREGLIAAYQTIKAFIDNSLPEEPASKDLDFLAISLEETIGTSPHSREVIKEHLQKAAEWQKKKDQETIELAEDHAMLAGMNRMKEEMMKNAVDGQIYREYIGEDGISNAFGIEAYLDEHNPKHNKLHDGDKVKIIIVKTE